MDSFQTLSTLECNQQKYHFYHLQKLPKSAKVERLPFSLKILLENLLRKEDGNVVQKRDIDAILQWDPTATPNQEIAFTPARVLLQDFTGVPAVVDLAAMRDAMKKLKGDPNKINPLSPVDLVIDHSVMVDHFGTDKAFQQNVDIEYQRNSERYTFLRWGQNALDNFRVVPPDTGIVHQVNLEYLAHVVFENKGTKPHLIYPDTLVGTDSHTTMINGLGVLGWGVGGIEAEAAMLGQPLTMLIPQVVGFELKGALPEGSTATDLVLVIVEMLRKHGVVGKFVEFYGQGLDSLPLADRATIANMAPEYGATCGIFPIDIETLNYLRLSGRPDAQVALVEAYARAQGMFRDSNQAPAEYSETLSLNLNTVLPSIAGPKRPQDRIALNQSKKAFHDSVRLWATENKRTEESIDDIIQQSKTAIKLDGESHFLEHGKVVIAAITSCTNTSNPAVMLAAGLVAKKARQLGLQTKPWVKTSLAPGSQVVTDYLTQSGLLKELNGLGFNLVGYGCTTCIGNSGPLPESVSEAIQNHKLLTCAVLSGNRNFEGRIHPQVRNAYLASPPLVVAYALAGTMNFDPYHEPLAYTKDDHPVFLKDIWPSQAEINQAVQANLDASLFTKRYAEVFSGDSAWQQLHAPLGDLYAWDEHSTYVKNPPYFEGMSLTPAPIHNIEKARVLAFLGDSVTTDHISPAGSIAADTPAGVYLMEKGIDKKDFNSYGARRGNHEVMMRGTFANIRLRNQMAPGTEGGWTTLQPDDKVMRLYDASMIYQQRNCPLVILAGHEYGTGSSRDWAAKGTLLLGVRTVIAQSFERIHRSNLVGMGILPLQFLEGQSAQSLGLTGKETFDIPLQALKPQGTLSVLAHLPDQSKKRFEAIVRIDTPKELEYYQHGGILQYVLRQLAKSGR